MDRHVTPPALEILVVDFVPTDTLLHAANPSIISDYFYTASAACHFATAHSGRMLRALIESLLL